MGQQTHLTRHDEELLLGLSLLVTICGGCAYILWRWVGRDQAVDGVLRCITFICAMIAVHAWGYQAYRHQRRKDPKGQTSGTAVATRFVGTLDYARPDPYEHRVVDWSFIIAQQGVVAFIASLILDGGGLLTICIASIIVYWLIVGFIWLSRLLHGRMTEVDRRLATCGFWPLVAVIGVGCYWVWGLKGLL